MSLADADQVTPQIHLSTIINTLAPADFRTSRIIVMSPNYMKELANILYNTSKEVLQTYFLWKATQAFASDIEADAIKPYKRFANELQGKVRRCYRLT
jgi:endothelin-converting enzyme